MSRTDTDVFLVDVVVRIEATSQAAALAEVERRLKADANAPLYGTPFADPFALRLEETRTKRGK